MRVKKSAAVLAVAALGLCACGMAACIDGESSYITVTDGTLVYGGYIYEDAEGNVTSGNFTVRGYKGEPTDIVVPETVEGYTVTSVSSDAFKDCKSLESVTFSANITRIPAEAFAGCDNLGSIEIAEENTVYASGGNCIIQKNINTLIYGCKNSVIPEGVAVIGKRAFADCVNLAEIVIPDSVTTIEEAAFYNCTALESAEILGLDELGGSAFYGCSSLTEITLPDGLTVIGERAFGGCESLTEIALPESVQRIGSFAFADCKSLTDLVLPRTSQTGEGVLSGCAALQSLTAPFAERYSASAGKTGITALGYYFGTQRYEGGTVTEQWESVIDFGNSREYISYYVPAELKKITVTGDELPDTAFNNCTLIEEIYLSNSVAQIGLYGFYGCEGLKSLTAENGEVVLKTNDFNISHAFYGCNALEYAELPAEAFTFVDSKNLKTAIITGGQAIGGSAFKDLANLESVIIAESIISIGDEALRNCVSLTELTVPEGVAEVGIYAFGGCASLEMVYWNAVGCTVSNMPFTQCGALEKVTFGESVKIIPDGLMYFCSDLKEAEIPEGVEEIGEEAFFGCGGLKSIFIPASITVIGDDAFKYCTGLEEVCVTDIASWCGIDFTGDYSNPLYLAKNLSIGGVPAVDLVLPDGLTHISKDAFICCEGIKSVTLPSSLTFIGDSAFWYCNNLERIYISDFTAWCNMEMRSNPLAYAREGLFLNGERLSGDFTVEEGITRIPSYTFMYSTIRNVILPKTLGYIDYYAFLFCNELDGVYISDFAAWCGIRFNNSNPMGMADNLYLDGQILSGEFIVPDGVTVIPYCTFKNSEVTSVRLPDGLITIEQQAFRDCRYLTEVIIPDSVEEVSASAFMRCYRLKRVYFGGTEEKWISFAVEFYSEYTVVYFCS